MAVAVIALVISGLSLAAVIYEKIRQHFREKAADDRAARIEERLQRAEARAEVAASAHLVHDGTNVRYSGDQIHITFYVINAGMAAAYNLRAYLVSPKEVSTSWRLAVIEPGARAEVPFSLSTDWLADVLDPETKRFPDDRPQWHEVDLRFLDGRGWRRKRLGGLPGPEAPSSTDETPLSGPAEL